MDGPCQAGGPGAALFQVILPRDGREMSILGPPASLWRKHSKLLESCKLAGCVWAASGATNEPVQMVLR